MGEPRRCLLSKIAQFSIIVGLVALPLGVCAEEPAAGEAPAAGEGPALEEVVVTAVALPTSRLVSSVSTSSVSLEDVPVLAPRSTEEIFRSLPGIRSESSGGEGNANITVRGIPLATGGSKYLQIMEDGVPVLEYGDLNFANVDNFVRYDWSVQRIESVRGGSASTFASDSPGGIINFISNTGEHEGGAVGASFGLGYSEARSDFAYGGKLSDTVNFHIGGYYRNGEGVRHTGFNGENGGQIKINLTKQLDDGFLRFFVKHLDDRVATYLPSAVLVKSNGSYGPLGGYDASHDSTYSRYQTQINTFDAYGNPVSRDLTDGIHARVDAFGFEFDKDAGSGWHINDKLRNSKIGGGFISPFTDTIGSAPAPAQAYGDGVCAAKAALGAKGCTGTIVTFATGPNAGKVYSGPAFTNLQFDATFHDVGLFVNDLKVSKTFGSVAATLGYYTAHQKIAVDWNSWQVFAESVSRDPVPLNIVSTTGQAITSNGLADPAFLSWSWNLNYNTTAPYLNIGGSLDGFTWDASARYDSVRARGTLYQACCGTGVAGLDLNKDGRIDPFEQGYAFSPTGLGFVSGNVPSGRINYDAHHVEYSLGGSFRITNDTATFARYSSGARFDADRLLQISGALNPDGSLTSGTKGYDLVKQFEAGYKLIGRSASFYATYFHTKTEETNAEITSGLTFLRSYKADGLELEGNWTVAGFELGGNLTYTHAKISSDALDPAVVGNKPRRQADLIWTITPQYRAERWDAGVTLQGSTAYFLADDNQLPDSLKQNVYTLVNAFARVNVTDALSAVLNVNNVFDQFVVTEAENHTGVAGSIIRARPLSGRSANISLRYSF